jgi:large subunit ribosomal protein L3
MEIEVGVGPVKERLDYAKGLLGKTVTVNEIFKEGTYVDVVAVSKGKGIQGPVKRFGIRVRQLKSRKMKRGVGTLGPWHPARVLYTIPRAGQMGYHQRVEYNKRILKIGTDGKEVTPQGGFIRYGVVKNMYALIEGSVPGPAKRLIRLRMPARPPKSIPEAPPSILQISTISHQG